MPHTSNSDMVTRESVTQAILRGIRIQKLQFSSIATAIDRSQIWTTAAIFGQHPMEANMAEKVLELVGIGRNEEFILLMGEIPSRAQSDVLNRNDPTIKRLQEVVDVYGPSIKAIIHELFEDGVISATDCKVDVDKKGDPAGDRVVITIDGKFLPYKPW